MIMKFTNSKGIFLQIADSISEKILEGEFPPGGKIPSVRDLATDLGVNPNTVMRTYSELQSRGIVAGLDIMSLIMLQILFNAGKEMSFSI
jgi:GntR family transcriptional regulator